MFFDILFSSALPIFLVIGIGVLVDHIFDLDLPTLSRLSFNVLIPAILFTVLYNSELQARDIADIGAFLLLHTVVIFMIGLGLYSIKPLREKRRIMLMGTIFYNSANYGIPLMALAFKGETVSIIAIVMTTQIILTFTVGFMLMAGEGGDLLASVKTLLRYPVLYVIALAFLMRGLNVTLPSPIEVALERIADAYIAIALLMLGMQLSRSQVRGNGGPVGVVTIMRLIISPLIGTALMLLFDFEPLIQTVLIVVTGLPVAVNVYVMSIELGREQALASRLIFWTTLTSIITVPIMLMLVR